MYDVIYTNQFKKSLKLCVRKLDIPLCAEVDIVNALPRLNFEDAPL
ncbi:MAG: hypothetical protein IJV06_00765 [Bacteroidaceae bacterium]|nr:hypothetical protein [Bacteroidaceae bacterium]